MKRNIFLTESQILKIKEDIRALNYKDDITKTKGSWKEIPIEFNNKLYHDRPDRYKKTSNVNNLVRFYEFEDGSITLSPISKQINVRVNGKWDKMSVWGLGFLSDKAFNQAIKKDSIKKTDSQGNETNVKVNWVNDAKNKLLSYCAQYATKALPYICEKEGTNVSNIGYISWPYSSSSFNNDFVKNFLVPALNKEGINISESDIIQNIVVKSRNMKIDYEIAQKIGLDDVDIKALQAFVMAQKQAENLLVIRQRIDNFVRQVQSDISNNNVEQFYQYTRNSKKEEEDKKRDTFNTQGMYFNNVNKDSKNAEWVKQRSNSRMTKVDLTKGKANTTDKIEDYEIGENFNDIAKKLLAQKELIIKLYDDTKKETENIKNQQEITDDKGRKFNVKDDFGHFEHENNVVANKERTALNILDDTVDSNGKTKDKSWEIKKFAESCRHVLYDLFKVNDYNKNMNYDKSKTLIIFDDNVAGGRTLASTCETLLTGEKGVRWEKIIPLTISFMNITPDTSPINRSKQDNYRDKIAVQNNMYNDGVETIIDSNDKSYEIHNFGDIDIWDNPYTNSKKKQQTRQEQKGQQKNIPTEPKRRGRPRKFNTNTQTTNIQNITESYIKKFIIIMENKNITILWLDDQREPYSYFKKKKTDSGAWVRNNDFYQENIFKHYKPNFIWVKNLPEFSEYIIKNGLPDLVSFDHDLSSKTVRCDHNGADCARWLVNYCKENGLQMPKCFAHTANNKQRPILNDILGLNESIILESCDYVFNDEGQKCNSTGTVWKGVEYAKNKKNVPKGIGAYPFIIHNGRLFASTTPNGHGDFLKTEVLPKTEYNGVMVNSLKQELSINNRHVSICGRLFPNVNSDGSSIMTIWNPKEHGLTDEKNISAVIKLLADYFKIEPSMIKYEIKSGQLIQPTYQATSEDVKNLLKHNREIAQMSGLKTIEQYDTPVNDKDIYTAYATKPYSTLKPREKEMFHNLRGQDTRGNEELRNHLMKHNPNFTQAQWNAMSTIGDSKIKKTNVITESQLRKIIKETILEYLRK